MTEKNYFKQFWDFLRQDSWSSLVVTLIIAFIVIKFILFPILSLATGSSLPLVIVESCSMHHYENGFDKIFSTSNVYANNNISESQTVNWVFQDGFNKGDIIFVVGAKDVKVGDVIIFNGGAAYPIIHRVVSAEEGHYETKGDNNNYQITPGCNSNGCWTTNEKDVPEDQILGKALFRIPYVGWIKLIFYEFSRPPSERGFCS